MPCKKPLGVSLAFFVATFFHIQTSDAWSSQGGDDSQSHGAPTPPPPSVQAKLKIAGTPPSLIAAGQYYSFKPTVVARAGATLTYQIANKPSWASFNPASGLLSGTPAARDAATFPGISITVADGRSRALLAAFKIIVAPAVNGSALLSWVPPTANADGSPLVNLAGFRIYYGNNALALNQIIAVNSSSITSASVDNLAAGNWYFALAAITSAGMESTLSAIASTTIR